LGIRVDRDGDRLAAGGVASSLRRLYWPAIRRDILGFAASSGSAAVLADGSVREVDDAWVHVQKLSGPIRPSTLGWAVRRYCVVGALRLLATIVTLRNGPSGAARLNGATIRVDRSILA